MATALPPLLFKMACRSDAEYVTPLILSPDVCTNSGKGCFFSFFQKPIVAGQPVPPQFSWSELAPLNVIGTLEPEAVSTVEPVTVHAWDSGPLGQLTVTTLVAVDAVAVNDMVPGTVVI